MKILIIIAVIFAVFGALMYRYLNPPVKDTPTIILSAGWKDPKGNESPLSESPFAVKDESVGGTGGVGSSAPPPASSGSGPGGRGSIHEPTIIIVPDTGVQSGGGVSSSAPAPYEILSGGRGGSREDDIGEGYLFAGYERLPSGKYVKVYDIY